MPEMVQLLSDSDLPALLPLLPGDCHYAISWGPLRVELERDGRRTRIEVGDWLVRSQRGRLALCPGPTAAVPVSGTGPVRCGEAALLEELRATKAALNRANNALTHLGYRPYLPA